MAKNTPAQKDKLRTQLLLFVMAMGVSLYLLRLHMHLAPCLLSPLAEFFPDQCLSWWVPPNCNIAKYRRRLPLRALAVAVVWAPILRAVSFIASTYLVALLAVGVFAAFGLHLLGSDERLDQVEASLAWKTACADKKRRTHLLAVFRENALSKAPQMLYIAAFSSIASVTASSLPYQGFRALLSVCIVFAGAAGMQTYRLVDNQRDTVARLVFVFGFNCMLHYIGWASSAKGAHNLNRMWKFN